MKPSSWTVYWHKVLVVVREGYAELRNEIATAMNREFMQLEDMVARERDAASREELEEQIRRKESRRENAPAWKIVNIFAFYDRKRKVFALDQFLTRVLGKWRARDDADRWPEECPGLERPEWPDAGEIRPTGPESTMFVLAVVLALLAINQTHPESDLRLAWPPPRKLVGRLCAEIAGSGAAGRPSSGGSAWIKRGKKNRSGILYLRIPEIVLRFLLWSAIKETPVKKEGEGWPDQAWRRFGWGGRVLEAWQKLLDYVRESVDTALLSIEGFEPRFDRQLDRDEYARVLLQELMAEELECGCVGSADERYLRRRIRAEYLRTFHRSYPSDQERARLSCAERDKIFQEARTAVCDGQEKRRKSGSLRRNISNKARTCASNHRLFGWVPRKTTLWEFLQEAVKGGTGPFRAVGFESSMLRHLIWKTYPELELVPVAIHHCLQCCGETAIAASCRCGCRFHPSRNRVKHAKYWVWNDDLVETHPARLVFEETAYLSCSNPARDLAGPALISCANGRMREKDVVDWPRLVSAIVAGRSEPRTLPFGCVWSCLPEETRGDLLAASASGSKVRKSRIQAGLNWMLRNSRLWTEPAFDPGSAGQALGGLIRRIRSAFASASRDEQHEPDCATLNRLILDALLEELIKPARCGNLYRTDSGEAARQSDPLDGCGHPRQTRQKVTWLHLYKGGATPRRFVSLDQLLRSLGGEDDTGDEGQ